MRKKPLVIGASARPSPPKPKSLDFVFQIAIVVTLRMQKTRPYGGAAQPVSFCLFGGGRNEALVRCHHVLAYAAPIWTTLSARSTQGWSTNFAQSCMSFRRFSIADPRR